MPQAASDQRKTNHAKTKDPLFVPSATSRGSKRPITIGLTMVAARSGASCRPPRRLPRRRRERPAAAGDSAPPPPPACARAVVAAPVFVVLSRGGGRMHPRQPRAPEPHPDRGGRRMMLLFAAPRPRRPFASGSLRLEVGRRMRECTFDRMWWDP